MDSGTTYKLAPRMKHAESCQPQGLRAKVTCGGDRTLWKRKCQHVSEKSVSGPSRALPGDLARRERWVLNSSGRQRRQIYKEKGMEGWGRVWHVVGRFFCSKESLYLKSTSGHTPKEGPCGNGVIQGRRNKAEALQGEERKCGRGDLWLKP